MGQVDDDRISLEIIQEMFEGMKNSDGWRLDGDLLWGYFFIDKSKPKLERLARRLEQDGYGFVSIEAESAGFLKAKDHRLHVERVEHHTPESLYAHNDKLYAFAAEYGVASYDGMDVGPVD